MLSGLLETRKLRARPVVQIVTKLHAASRVETSSISRFQMGKWDCGATRFPDCVRAGLLVRQVSI